MMIACRIFSGRNKEDTDYYKRFLPGSKDLIYVIDELALKAHNRHDSKFQSVKGLFSENSDGVRAIDEAFVQRQGYDLIEFLDKFIKPVMLLNPPGQTTIISTEDWPRVVKEYRVWVNVQDGARSIATPCTGQLIRDLEFLGKNSDVTIELESSGDN